MNRLEASGGVRSESALHERLLQAWASAFAGASVRYLSGPITTGPRFMRWYLEAGSQLVGTPAYTHELRRKVIEPNSAEIVQAAQRLRLLDHKPVLEPATLHISEWSQDDYVRLWEEAIERFASGIVLMPGWQYSTGCALELLRAISCQLPVETLDGGLLSTNDCITALEKADREIIGAGVPIAKIGEIAKRLRDIHADIIGVNFAPLAIRKDKVLHRLAKHFNVAQFVAFEPAPTGPAQTYSRIRGYQENWRFSGVHEALSTLLEKSAETSINIRSFVPESPQSLEFVYGITNVEDACASALRLTREGLHIIANETVDVRDGGVSGVLMGDAIEFAPDDTPRCVEKPGVVSLPRDVGVALLTAVYGFLPELNVPRASRLEFSIHPQKRGWRAGHTLVWEYADLLKVHASPVPTWPNNFSRMIGDKVFGLLIAHFYGFRVPKTTVVTRRVAVFSFGQDTGSGETWLRTSPREQHPGKFSTCKGWRDPFLLMHEEDPDGTEIASVLSQAAVPAGFSGAAIVTSTGELLIEGVAGEGDALMLGRDLPTSLPLAVIQSVREVYERARAVLGPVRFEWVHDGEHVWVVQLHRGATQSDAVTIVPGEPSVWIDFETNKGLEALRETVASLPPGSGLLLRGRIGLTSHFADVIRRAAVPARIAS